MIKWFRESQTTYNDQYNAYFEKDGIQSIFKGSTFIRLLYILIIIQKITKNKIISIISEINK